MNRFLVVGAAALLMGIGLSAPAAARSHAHQAAVSRPGDHQFVVIEDHDPRRLQRAARTARDLVAHRQVREFRIILSGRAVLLAIPGSNIVQKEVVGIMRKNPRISLVVCREVVAALTQAAHRRPPLLPGTKVMACAGLGGKMQSAGWESVPGL